MIVAFHRLRRSEDGQALALGAVFLLVLAIALLGTMRLSDRIHERVALQDGADAAALSLAVEEARAFNFYAYTNRAQIAQYVTILQLLSIDAILLGLLASMGTFAAIGRTIGEICSGERRPACLALPVIGELLALFSTAMQVAERIVVSAGRAIEAFDAFVGEVAIPMLVASNVALFAQQLAAHARVVALLAGDEAIRIARRAAPRARMAVPFQPLNVTRFEATHLAAAMNLWGQRDRPGATLRDGAPGRRNWARRGMAELIHASRWDSRVYDRSFPGLPGGGEGKAFEVVQEFLAMLPAARMRGHTRLLGEEAPGPDASAAIYRRMERSGYGTARYPLGNAIGANFYLEIGRSLGGPFAELGRALGLGQKHFASVTSTSPADGGGWACTWDVSRPYLTLGVPGDLGIYVPRYTCDFARGRHPWWGITPYMAFDADRGCDRPAAEGCQPDVWVALRSGEDGPVAVARALAYYHRPGNWQEPPNFFNPFWRARLVPTEPGLDRLGPGGKALRALLDLGGVR